MFNNLKLEDQDNVSRKEDINQLGNITLKFNKLLNCKNMHKPFVYKKKIIRKMRVTYKKKYTHVFTYNFIRWENWEN